jgi:carbamate kinase
LLSFSVFVYLENSYSFAKLIKSKTFMKKLAVVAFGGNALLRPGEKGTIDEQEKNVYETCENLIELIKRDHDIVITHGNGPQVGNILLQNQAGAELHGIPEMPLDICGAYSQGFIGYMIEQQLRNVLEVNGMERDVITLVTQVLVDKNDPAFANQPVLSQRTGRKDCIGDRLSF